MRQIIYGETPKTKTYGRKEIDKSLDNIKEDFSKIIDHENCIYAKSLKRVNNGVLNFLNTFKCILQIFTRVLVVGVLGDNCMYNLVC